MIILRKIKQGKGFKLYINELEPIYVRNWTEEHDRYVVYDSLNKIIAYLPKAMTAIILR